VVGETSAASISESQQVTSFQIAEGTCTSEEAKSKAAEIEVQAGECVTDVKIESARAASLTMVQLKILERDLSN
jgi:hypothetical protein